MSEMSDSDAIGRGVSVRNVRCVLDTGRTDTLGHVPVKITELLHRTFGGSVYVENPTRSWGERPNWLDWPTVNLTEFHPLAPVEPVKDPKRLRLGTRSRR